MLAVALRNFSDNTPGGYLYALPAVVAQHPSFLRLLRDTPASIDIDPEQIKALLPTVEGITKEWLADILTTLFELVPDFPADAFTQLPLPSEIQRKLELATTWFWCQHCKEPISYPRIFFHRCLRSRTCADQDELSGSHANSFEHNTQSTNALVDPSQSADEGPTNEDILWGRTEETKKGLGPWNLTNDVQYISRCDQLHERAISLLRASCLDPETTTHQVLQLADPRLDCADCTARKGTTVWMNWTTAVRFLFRKERRSLALISFPFSCFMTLSTLKVNLLHGSALQKTRQQKSRNGKAHLLPGHGQNTCAVIAY